MKRYVYVEARDVSMPEDGGPMVSFAGVVVSAPDDEVAYAEGYRQMKERAVAAAGDENYFGHFDGGLMNDFVMEIPS